MQNVHFLSNLKLCAGYGVVASSEVDPYETKGTLSQKPYNYGSESIFGYAPNKMPNTILLAPTDFIVLYTFSTIHDLHVYNNHSISVHRTPHSMRQ